MAIANIMNPKICKFLLWAALLVCLGQAMELDKDGGYRIVVGIDPTEFGSRISDEEPAEYINNLKIMIQDFSQLLWESTNSVFHIKSVYIIVPDSWVAGLNANVSVKATYHRADIQISDGIKVPLAENFYPCGKPGVRIQLPTEFVDKAQTEQIYGSQAKGLLNLWLRYRFGVWEEHGYPDDLITPYMYNLNDMYESHWQLTSCNNSRLNGDFAPELKSRPNDTCILNGATPIADNCRFYPYQDRDRNNATSSLMNFHWVESLDRLCNISNHDKLAPNRQNLYCNFKSLWEVIESSPDYKLLESGRSERLESHEVPPHIEFNVVGTSLFPILYILLDVHFSFIFDPQNVIYGIWLNSLREFIDKLPRGVIAKLVRFPTRAPSNLIPTPEIEVAVDWSIIGVNVNYNFKAALSISSDGFVFHPADLRLGISQAVAELQERNHLHGAVLLVLRNRDIPFVYENQDGHGAYEQDYIFELKQSGVKMCAIEFAESQFPFKCLGRMAEESGGTSGLVFFNDSTNAQAAMKPVLQFVLKQFLPRPVGGLSTSFGFLHSQSVKYELIYKQLLQLETPNVSVLIPRRNDFEFLHIYVTVNGSRLDNIEFGPSTAGPFEFSEHSEYFKDNDIIEYDPIAMGKRGYSYFKVFYKEELNAKIDNETWAWRLSMVSDDPGKGHAMIMVYVSKQEDSSSNLNAEIFTSALNDRFSCAFGQPNEEPLYIYTKLTGPNGKPILFQTPTASLVEARGTGATTVVELNDAGIGPDLFDGDGVYSGLIYPQYFIKSYHKGTFFEIYVTLYETTTNLSKEVTRVGLPTRRTRVLPKILQTDLTDFVTNGTTLSTPYSIVFKWPHVLYSEHSCVGKKYISHITDLRVQLLDESKFTITFSVPMMTTTGVRGQGEETGVLDFTGMASLSSSLSTLMLDFEGGSIQNFTVIGARPGETVIQTLADEPGMKFLAIRLTHKNGLVSNSPISNVVRGWRAVPDATENDPLDSPLDCGLLSCQLAIGVGCGVALLVLLVVSLFLWRKNRAQKESLRNLTREEVKEFLHGSPDPRVTENQAIEELDYDKIQSLPYDNKYEIPTNKLHIDRTDLLGSGMFGNVYKGYVVNFGGSKDKVLIVAVKTMKPGIDKAYFKAMLAEVKLMTLIGSAHPNIVKLVGASTKNIRKCEVFLATEFCANGSLSSYLLNLEPEAVTVWNLLKWGREIANGMEYLGQKRVVHGDLAARNILLDSQLVAKITDFGLSKQLVNYSYGYSNIEPENAEIPHKDEIQAEGGGGGGGGLLPWKWLAPESLKKLKFSVASDVWAYGITIWEIFGLAREVPYPGIKWSADFVHRLEKDGLRLARPDFATDGLYELMLSCWELDPAQRPGFCTLKNALDKMMVTIRPAEYMQVEAQAEQSGQYQIEN